jgi:hypothetical protein
VVTARGSCAVTAQRYLITVFGPVAMVHLCLPILSLAERTATSQLHTGSMMIKENTVRIRTVTMDHRFWIGLREHFVAPKTRSHKTAIGRTIPLESSSPMVSINLSSRFDAFPNCIRQVFFPTIQASSACPVLALKDRRR